MAVTGACAEAVVYLTASPEHEVDFGRPVRDEEIVRSVEEQLEPVADSDRFDEPVYPNTAFGI
jgi:hypothetical protein